MKGPKNFASDQTVFHRDDVPAARRERKKEVKEVLGVIEPGGSGHSFYPCVTPAVRPRRMVLEHVGVDITQRDE